MPGGFAWLAQRAGDNTAARIAHDASVDEYGLRRVKARTGLLVDVGANIGDMTVAMALLRPQMQILAIEPVPSTYFFLRWNLLLNNLTVLSSAAELGPLGRAGVLPLNAATTGDPTPNQTARVRFGVASQDARLESAAMLSDTARTRHYLRWDSTLVPTIYLPSNLGGWSGVTPSVTLLKLDCELCEYDVISSDREWFTNRRRVKYVAGELHSGARVPEATMRAVRQALVARGCRPPTGHSNGRMCSAERRVASRQ